MPDTIPVIYYNELNQQLVNKKYARVISQLQQGDFAGAEVKKMVNCIYYRARLDEKDRLLFTWVEYNGRKHLLLLELITNHEYQKSRFLRGGLLPEEKEWIELKANDSTPAPQLTYLNQKDGRIHALNKFISFDNEQADIYAHQPPMVLIGSAGSGKTVLVLEKIKQLPGRILYTSLSRYLVDNARRLYYANGYDNEAQEIDFLSFNQYMATWQQPAGREVTFRMFSGWFQRNVHNMRFTDAHKLFEEYRGVITGQSLDKEYFTKEEYLALGVRQSVYTGEERLAVYQMFEKYVEWMQECGYYDSNMLSNRYAASVEPVYDYVVVDEVQDITNAQLQFILRSLVSKNGFILTGDSNQIVHPNFFSWAAVKSYFYTSNKVSLPIHILHTNYRNSSRVVQLSNRLLSIKNQRFGSIDKESNYLVKTNSTQQGEVLLLQGTEKALKDLNQRTVQSAEYAVIVPKDEDKAAAAKIFKTPLLFSVHEAKGLEYANVILLDFVSGSSKEFNVITEGISAEGLDVENLTYNRPADKTDKEGEIYKFFINSLYVALTRALTNIYMVEQLPGHNVLQLLGLAENKAAVNIQTRQSTKEEWLEEAQRLEAQGKVEQAEAIRAKVLGYDYMSAEELERVRILALDPAKKEQEVKRERKQLYAYAEKNNRIDWIDALAGLQFQRAMLFMKEVRQARKEYAKNCRLGRVSDLMPLLKKYGVDFHTDDDGVTGLMVALGNNQQVLAAKLMELNANIYIEDKNRYLAFHHLLNNYLNGVIRKQPNMPNARLLSQYWYVLRPVSIKVTSGGQLKNLAGHRLYTLVFWLMQCFEKEIGLISLMENRKAINTLNTEANNYKAQIAAIRHEILYDSYEIDKKARMRIGKIEKSLDLLQKDIEKLNEVTNINEFSIDNIVQLISCLPPEVLPEDKKKKTTISGILASHEIESSNAYNKKLFKRVGRGYYVLNPDLKFGDG